MNPNLSTFGDNGFFGPVLVLTLENPEPDCKNCSLRFRFRFRFRDFPELDRQSGSGFRENYPWTRPNWTTASLVMCIYQKMQVVYRLKCHLCWSTEESRRSSTPSSNSMHKIALVQQDVLYFIQSNLWHGCSATLGVTVHIKFKISYIIYYTAMRQEHSDSKKSMVTGVICQCIKRV